MKLTMGSKALKAAFRGNLVGKAPSKHKSQNGSFSNRQKELETSLVLNKDKVPPIDAVLNLHDFASIAQNKMVATGRKQAWDYYSSGADDELTYNENVNAFQRIWLRPRILVNVKEVDMSSKILGVKTSMPLYLSAVAMCGMGHEDGEVAWTKAAGEQDIVFMVPNLSSKDIKTITDARVKRTQPLMFQIYVNPDREIVKEQVKWCEKAGYRALCITVDSAVPGKRERDLRNKIQLKLKQIQQQKAAAKGTKSRKAGSYANRDPALCWDDVDWFMELTKMPIVLKGVATAEDAVLAAKKGVAAIILSNHGGRNLDTSRSGIEILPEVMNALKSEGLHKKMEVWVDGGVRRGTSFVCVCVLMMMRLNSFLLAFSLSLSLSLSVPFSLLSSSNPSLSLSLSTPGTDILKALALGATAVGVGKPAVYSMSAYGSDGISKMVEILREELAKCMRLVGAPTLADINENMIDISSLKFRVPAPIPPSPYVSVAPAYNVRDPSYPKQPDQMNEAELRAQIAKLQTKLKSVTSGGASSKSQTKSSSNDNVVIFYFFAFFSLLAEMIKQTVLRPVVSLQMATSLSRSALFLVAFLVVHAAGNMTVFAGSEVFNGYGHKLTSNPLIKFIEYYLLLAGVVHGVTASVATFRKRKFIQKAPAKNGVLAITAIVGLIFVVFHLLDLRFGEEIMTRIQGGENVRDLYGLQLKLFSSPGRVLFYEVGVAAIGIHLWKGWTKAARKMDVSKEMKKAFELLGHGLVFPVCTAFAICPMYVYDGGELYVLD